MQANSTKVLSELVKIAFSSFDHQQEGVNRVIESVGFLLRSCVFPLSLSLSMYIISLTHCLTLIVCFLRWLLHFTGGFYISQGAAGVHVHVHVRVCARVRVRVRVCVLHISQHQSM